MRKKHYCVAISRNPMFTKYTCYGQTGVVLGWLNKQVVVVQFDGFKSKWTMSRDFLKIT